MVEENNTIYISEPLTGRPDIEEIKGFCRAVATVCTELGLNPYLPFDATDPNANPDVSTTAVYQKDKTETESAKGIVFVIPGGESQSIGVGMEMGYSSLAHVPGVVVIDRGAVLEDKVDGLISENEARGLWARVLMNGLSDENVLGNIKMALRDKVAP